MFVLVRKNRVGVILTGFVYSLLALHTVLVVSRSDLGFSAIPNSEIIMTAWGFAGVSAGIVCVLALIFHSREIERIGLTLFSSQYLVFSASGFFIPNNSLFPGHSTSVLALAVTFLMIIHVMRLTIQIREDKKLEQALENSKQLTDNIVGEVVE